MTSAARSGRPTHVVVLGAGFGGLQLSSRLSAALGDAVRITLIDRSEGFVFGFSKLDVMFRQRTVRDVRVPYRNIGRPNVEFRRETVTGIDPEQRRVVTDAATYQADVLVVALGADLTPDVTPGLTEHGHEFYSVAGAVATAAALEDFRGGDIVIGVLGGFFKCPPAPYETAFMLHDFLTRGGLRADTSIHVVTPMGMPIPISAETSGAILSLLDERGIRHSHATWIGSLDADRVQLTDGRTLPVDLFLGVPVHAAPPVVVDSGLTEDGWIPVDPATLETRFPGVFAVGDVTSAPVPRAGVVAEGEADTVADVLLHRLACGPVPQPFAGKFTCYIEMGGDTIGKVDAAFLAGPETTAVFTPPSSAGAADKQRFAATRHERWFARG